jgi:hypothetical protein
MVERMEPRDLPSALPVLSHQTFNAVFNELNVAATAYSKSRNQTAFIATLGQISKQIPYGYQKVFPTWKADVARYSPTVPGSGIAMVNQMKVDLSNYVVEAVAGHTIKFT